MNRDLVLTMLFLCTAAVVGCGDKDDELYEGDEPGECSDDADNDRDGDVDCDDDGCAGTATCSEGDADTDADSDSDTDSDSDSDTDADSDSDSDADTDTDTDTDVSGDGCADIDRAEGFELWDRSDIFFCAADTMPTIGESASLCSAGWHVCTSAEFIDRNDSADEGLLAFTATVDDGEECMVTNNPEDGKHSLLSDDVRADAPGTCSPSTSSGSLWGLQTSGGYHGQTTPWGTVGALCCW